MLAKEKGFEGAFGWGYQEDGILELYRGRPKYPAPTQSLLQKWLRDVHKICLYVAYDDSEGNNWIFKFYSMDEKEDIYLFKVNFDTYEEALEAGLLEALKLIK